MTTTHDFMLVPAFQIPSTIPGYHVNQTAEKARPVKRDASQMEKGLSKLDTQECATIKKKKENKKEGDSDSLIASDKEAMYQQDENETEETDALKIRKLKVCSSLELYRSRMTTTHDFMPAPAFQIPSQTLLEYDVHKTTKKVHAIKEDALQIEKGLSKLDTPEYPTITPQVKEMKEKATNLIEKSHNLICDIEMMRLPTEIEREETEQLKIMFKEEQKSKCEKLALEIEGLKDKMKKLEESENIIHLTQATWLFERYIAMFVLPPTEKVGLFGCYKQMKRYINTKTTNRKEREERLESKERWLKLQTTNEVQWSESHWEAIEDLREARNKEAHPPVDFHKAKEDIENTTPQNTEECLDIIKMVETLNSVMLLGCLACKLQVLTATEWANLTSEIEWSPDHDKALLEMKKLKGNAEQEVLQKVDLEEAKKHLNGYVPGELLRQCFDIVDILKNMPLQ